MPSGFTHFPFKVVNLALARRAGQAESSSLIRILEYVLGSLVRGHSLSSESPAFDFDVHHQQHIPDLSCNPTFLVKVPVLDMLM